MAPKAIALGRLAVLLRGAVNTTPATEVPNVADLTVTLDSTTADATARDDAGWDNELVAHKKASLSWTLTVDEEAASVNLVALQAFKDAYINGTPLALHAKTTSTGRGPMGDFIITKLERSENVKDVQMYSIEARHNTLYRVPTWTT